MNYHGGEGIKGCAICGFICATGCCACEHWTPGYGTVGVRPEIHWLMCGGSHYDHCDRPVGIEHFDLFVQGFETDYDAYGFVGGFVSDLVAEHTANELIMKGHSIHSKMRECDYAEHCRSRLFNDTEPTPTEADQMIAYINRIQARVTAQRSA